MGVGTPRQPRAGSARRDVRRRGSRISGEPRLRRVRGGGPTAPLVERARRAFFQSFFRLLLGFIALAEWVAVAWVLRACGVDVPAVLHVLAPVAVFLVNRQIVVRRGVARGPRPVTDRLLRAYVGFAFTSVFCTLFLGLAGLVWCAGALAAPLLAPPVVDAFADVHSWATRAGIAGLALLFLHGYTRGRRALTVTRLRVTVPGLPASLAGFRIVQLSDLHIGAYLGREELHAHVERVNALAPDLVCITGDLVDRAETCALGFPTLGGLRARHGVVVTLGNHDVYAGADVVTDVLRETTDFTVLRDAVTTVRVRGARLAVIGLDDLGLDWARGVPEHPALPGLVRAVPDRDVLLVLSHRPDCFPQAARLGADLVLSGHTHGGQLGLPARRGRVRNLAEFITRFPRGQYRHGRATLYVNHGLGFTGQPVRVFTPREIAVLELHPA